MVSILQAAVTQLLVVHKYILLLLLFVFILSAELQRKLHSLCGRSVTSQMLTFAFIDSSESTAHPVLLKENNATPPPPAQRTQ
jgi:hypothetical protein